MRRSRSQTALQEEVTTYQDQLENTKEDNRERIAFASHCIACNPK